MKLIFSNPSYFWFLVSIPFLVITHLFTLRHSKGAALKFSNFEAIARVSEEYRLAKPYGGLAMNKNFFILLLRVLTLLFVIMSLTGPVLWYTGSTSDFDFVLAIDASSSMLAADMIPNRLGAAKTSAALFVDKLSKSVGVGIVSFAGTSFVDQKITQDTVEVKKKINSLGIKNIGGTDLGGALVSSSNLLLSSDKSKIIILLTDGRSNVGIPIEEAITYVNVNNIRVYTIGVGTEEGGSFGAEELISTLDERTLKKVAADTNAKYYRARDIDELNTAYTEIANIKENELPFNMSILLIIIALSILFLEWVLVNTRYRIIS
ncbi:MAG: VWA domain-containing protein [Nanoarchaeota archaeon]